MPSRNRGKLKLKLRDLSRFPPTKEERDALQMRLPKKSFTQLRQPLWARL